MLGLLRSAMRTYVTSKPQVKLFTPGPLNTSENVKKAMLYDFGSRDPDFGRLVEDIKLKLLKIGGVNPREYATVLVQGSGTFAVEATLGTSFPKLQEGDAHRQVLIVANGSYGERQVRICEILGIPHKVLRYTDADVISPSDIKQKLVENPLVSHVSVVHSETTTGLLNPIDQVGKMVNAHNPNLIYIVDAMSSFGAQLIDMSESHIHYLVSSSNKMLQGVPGFAFVIAKINKLIQTRGNSRSLALDLYDQWDYQLSNPGQFRFTPPTHVFAAFSQALLEFEAEGGVKARLARYNNNQRILSEEMQKLGFNLYIDPSVQGNVITTFMQPDHPKFNFTVLYNYLSERQIVIYPGKLSKAPSFRLGNIGDLHAADMHECIEKLKEAFAYMQIPLPLPKK
jgi:2-aminoethylphosphonate-pyruvate transaminase